MSSIQGSVRQAMTEADELSRKAHAEHNEPVAQAFDSFRTALNRIDEAIGGGRSVLPFMPDVIRILDDAASFTERVAPEVREKYQAAIADWRSMVTNLERELDAIAPSLEIKSKPILGVLPIARVVPQDIHSLMDYAGGGLCIGTAAMAESTEARVAGAALGASVIAISALTDYRLSVAKVIPIETHEVLDHAWGLAAIAAPFVLGYYKKDPAVAALHVLTGATTILASLFTDYRAAEGLGRTQAEIEDALRNDDD